NTAKTALLKRLLGSQFHQIPNFKSFETDWLLKSIADSLTGTSGDIPVCDVFAIQQNLSPGRRSDTGDDLGDGGFSSAVWSGDHRHFPVWHGKIYAPQYFFSSRERPLNSFQFQHPVFLLLPLYLPRSV